ncbi:MAG: Dabb family protein [Actinomycetota bacterium]|nr:Dabb family protein [Actinomycetota bacterium]
MFHHVAMFRFKEGTTAEQVDAATTALRALPSQIDVLTRYKCGPDAGITDGSWDYVVVADVADSDDFATYRDHPAHRAVVTDFMAPIIAEGVRVQFES